MRKALLAVTVLVASIAIPAVCPQEANAQLFLRGRRFSIGIGTPFYGGYGYGGYYGGYRPYYYGYPSYGYYNRGFIGNPYYAPRYYGRYWW